MQSYLDPSKRTRRAKIGPLSRRCSFEEDIVESGGQSLPDHVRPEIMMALWQALTAESAACKERMEKETYEDWLLHSSAVGPVLETRSSILSEANPLLTGIFGAHEERV